MNTPILVIAFNRPDTLEVLFHRLKEEGSDNLYFAVDGPRANRPEEEGKVARVKALIQEYFQPAEDRCLYQPKNLGIRHGPPAGISWFFEKVETGVILEDDCIPGSSFFPFVQWALDAYRDQPQVKLISGFNRFSPCPWPESFRFVKTAMIWGWATWRRAWREFDPHMMSWDDPKVRRGFRRWIGSFPVYDYWRVAIEWVRIGKLVTWDVAWCWAVFQSQGLCVMPRVSLIRNIGFGADSTNTQLGDERAYVVPLGLEAPFLAPARNSADVKLQRRIDRAEFWRSANTWAGRFRELAKAIKRMFRARQS